MASKKTTGRAVSHSVDAQVMLSYRCVDCGVLATTVVGSRCRTTQWHVVWGPSEFVYVCARVCVEKVHIDRTYSLPAGSPTRVPCTWEETGVCSRYRKPLRTWATLSSWEKQV